ncbi:MAG: hypothetical protein R3C97_14125 [Geminicoccaceae bacterium]
MIVVEHDEDAIRSSADHLVDMGLVRACMAGLSSPEEHLRRKP